MNSLHELFEDGLRDIYYAEKAIVTALPKMAKSATSEDLKEAFTEHLEQTKGHVQRLEQVFEMMGVAAKAKDCPAIDGIIEEGEEIMKEIKDGMVRDAGLLAAAQAVEHYEIARYGTLRTWAEQLEMEQAAGLLEETLQEEKETDEKLTALAESEVNEAAETA